MMKNVEKSMYTAIEQKALGLATAQLTSLRGKFDDKDQWFEAYLAIDAHVTEGAKIPAAIEMLALHEDACEDWGDVHVRIQDEGEAIEQTIKECLELAKDGLADATIECEIDSDVNTYDMPGLVDRGAALAEA